MKIDLHNHTNYSDGKYSPKELVERAVRNHVDIFALTDHDSCFGDDEITEIAKDYNVKVIKGLEVSTNYKGDPVHIVCLFKNNIIPDSMMEFSLKIKNQRRERAIKMMENVERIFGLKWNKEELLNGNVITRGNMCRHLAKINNIPLEEAWETIKSDSPAYIPSGDLSVPEGVKLGRNANCVVILAHPCLIKEEYLDDILSYGFDAMEVKYPSPKNDEKKMRRYAKKYNLLISAGSDCHGEGEGVHGDHGDIGTSTLTEKEFEPIRKLLNF